MNSMTSLELTGIKKLNVLQTIMEDFTTACTIDSSVFSLVPSMIPKFKATLLTIRKVERKPSSSADSPHLFTSRPISIKVGPKDNCDTPVSLDSSISEDWPEKPVFKFNPTKIGAVELSLIPNDHTTPPVPGISRKVYSESALSSSATKFKDKRLELNKKSSLPAEDRGFKSDTMAAKKFDNLLNTNTPQNIKLEFSAYKELTASKNSASMSNLKPILSRTPRVGFIPCPAKKSPLSSTLGKKVSFAKNKILFVYDRI